MFNLKRSKNLHTIRKIFTFITPISSYFLLFGISFAQTAESNVCVMSKYKTLKDIIYNFVIGCVISRTVYLIMAVAVVVFLYGIFKFIRSEGDDKQGGKELMFWGIVGLFVMITLWGLVGILQNTFTFK